LSGWPGRDTGLSERVLRGITGSSSLIRRYFLPQKQLVAALGLPAGVARNLLTIKA